MATLELDPTGLAGSPAGRTAIPAGRAPAALAAALLGLATYAVFAHGAIAAPAEPRLQVALALVAALSLGSALWTRGLSLRVSPPAVAGVFLFGCFALWSGITVLWSVAPDLTWIEFNRVTAYALVLGLALTLGSSWRRSPQVAALGFFGLVLLTAVYALGQKLLPGVQVAGLVNLDQTAKIARLQEPLGYWNALALLLAMGAPVALALAARRSAPRGLRLLGAVGLQLIFLAIGFTYSRGGLVALVVALAACMALSGSWLRTATWLTLSALATLPPLVLGLVTRATSANGVALGRRETAGLLLLVVLAACAVVLAVAAGRLIGLEQTASVSQATRRRVVLGLRWAVVAAVLFGLVAVAASHRGLTGTFSHLWTSFTARQGVSVSSPRRFLSADAADRWVWWKEALGAFSARPIAGWGAGSFPVLHLMYRHNTLPVTHAHSAPLEWLAETGLIGTLAIGGALLLLGRAAWHAVRRQAQGEARLVLAGLFAAVLAYLLHSSYDWDWDIPGVTLPALIVLGVLAGSRGSEPRAGRPVNRGVTASPGSLPGAGPLARLLMLAAATMALCIYGLSAALPSIAAGRSSAALLLASRGTRAALVRAARDARAAGNLDPLSDAGPQALSTIALNAGEPQAARAYLLEAVRREPSDVTPWGSLAYLDLELGDSGQALVAAQRVLELDPLDPSERALALAIVQQVNVRRTPPQSSPTAIPTP